MWKARPGRQLRANETFFSDKRPFFTENQGRSIHHAVYNSPLVYTRRVGARRTTRMARRHRRRGPVNGSLGATQYVALVAEEATMPGARSGCCA